MSGSQHGAICQAGIGKSVFCRGFLKGEDQQSHIAADGRLYGQGFSPVGVQIGCALVPWAEVERFSGMVA